MRTVMRAKGEPLKLADAAKQAVHAIDPNVLVSNVTLVQALASQSVVGQSTSTVLIGALGVLALLLGLYWSLWRNGLCGKPPGARVWHSAGVGSTTISDI